MNQCLASAEKFFRAEEFTGSKEYSQNCLTNLVALLDFSVTDWLANLRFHAVDDNDNLDLECDYFAYFKVVVVVVFQIINK